MSDVLDAIRRHPAVAAAGSHVAAGSAGMLAVLSWSRSSPVAGVVAGVAALACVILTAAWAGAPW